MAELDPGLYEVLITDGVRARLQGLAADLHVTGHLLGGDAADRVAWHLSRQVERALRDVAEDRRVDVGIRVARDLLDRLGSSGLAVDPAERPAEPGAVLHAVLRRRPDGTPAPLPAPLIPVLDTSLLTNAPGEPTLWSQLLSEIESADEIDLVMAFIRRSGIRPLLPALRRHCASGRRLRVLTTTFTGTTEADALDQLVQAGAAVRVSYDTTATRLHAKAWTFRRHTGFTTVYVGSSNLTHTATNQGLEWNVRVSAARNADVVDKFDAVFTTYWESGDFVPYDRSRFEQTVPPDGLRSPTLSLPPTELRALPFQERLLELIEVSRRRGHHRNLLAAATGTGKTVMAALDFAALRRRLDRSRLLFVAHRKEILDQSLATFRYALRDPLFGELWVGGAKPTRFDHVFASIQSLQAADLDALAPDHFDVVIVDEFHRAAARSYERLS